MSVFGSIITGKILAAIITATAVTGGAGVAAYAGVLPEPLQKTAHDVIGAPSPGGNAGAATTPVDDRPEEKPKANQTAKPEHKSLPTPTSLVKHEAEPAEHPDRSEIADNHARTGPERGETGSEPSAEPAKHPVESPKVKTETHRQPSKSTREADPKHVEAAETEPHKGSEHKPEDRPKPSLPVVVPSHEAAKPENEEHKQQGKSDDKKVEKRETDEPSTSGSKSEKD